MLPLGVLILVIVLSYFSIILLSKQINNLITYINAKRPHPIQMLKSITHFLDVLQTEQTKYLSGLAAFIIALWNFFAPDFGDIHGGLTLIGALIPACVLFIDSLILTPTLLDIFPFGSLKDTLNPFLEKVTPVAGWITLLVTILHIALHPLPFF